MIQKKLPQAQQGDLAWLCILVGVVLYELTAKDLLSEATQRYCKRHPWLTRIVIGAVAGHLADVIPPTFDVFSAKNFAHQLAVAHFPFARPDRKAAA